MCTSSIEQRVNHRKTSNAMLWCCWITFAFNKLIVRITWTFLHIDSNVSPVFHRTCTFRNNYNRTPASNHFPMRRKSMGRERAFRMRISTTNELNCILILCDWIVHPFESFGKKTTKQRRRRLIKSSEFKSEMYWFHFASKSRISILEKYHRVWHIRIFSHWRWKMCIIGKHYLETEISIVPQSFF